MTDLKEKIRGALARGYCTDRNAKMDVVLCEAQVNEIMTVLNKDADVNHQGIDVEFQMALKSLINKHNIDNACNIPDYVLAGLVCENLSGIASAICFMEHHGWVNSNSKKETA